MTDPLILTADERVVLRRAIYQAHRALHKLENGSSCAEALADLSAALHGLQGVLQGAMEDTKLEREDPITKAVREMLNARYEKTGYRTDLIGELTTHIKAELAKENKRPSY